MGKLTKKNEVFCDEYLIDLNATQAAIRAGYSVESAGSIGSELLKKPEIRARIDRAMAERSKRTGINADRVLLLSLIHILFFFPRFRWRPGFPGRRRRRRVSGLCSS